MSNIDRDSIKSAIRILIHMQPIMIAQTHLNSNLWERLYQKEKQYEKLLRKAGFSWNAIMHIENLGSALYFKNYCKTGAKEAAKWMLNFIPADNN